MFKDNSLGVEEDWMFEKLNKILLWLIALYQKVLTLFSFGCCRYYPTCSEYTKQQLTHGRLIQGLWASMLRILRCNQLFIGGIDYPVVSKRFDKLSMVRPFTCIVFDVKFWFIPKSPLKYYVIKAFTQSNKT